MFQCRASGERLASSQRRSASGMDSRLRVSSRASRDRSSRSSAADNGSNADRNCGRVAARFLANAAKNPKRFCASCSLAWRISQAQSKSGYVSSTHGSASASRTSRFFCTRASSTTTAGLAFSERKCAKPGYPRPASWRASRSGSAPSGAVSGIGRAVAGRRYKIAADRANSAVTERSPFSSCERYG